MTFHTWIFGVYQEIDSYGIFFREGYIANLRAQIMTRSVFFFCHIAKDARKTRTRRRIRTKQNSPMGFRPLNESAPSARQVKCRQTQQISRHMQHRNSMLWRRKEVIRDM